MTTAGTADATLPPRHRSLVQRAMELLRSREWHQSVATAASRWQSGQSSERRQTLSTPSRCEEPSSEARSVSGSERKRALVHCCRTWRARQCEKWGSDPKSRRRRRRRRGQESECESHAHGVKCHGYAECGVDVRRRCVGAHCDAPPRARATRTARAGVGPKQRKTLFSFFYKFPL